MKLATSLSTALLLTATALAATVLGNGNIESSENGSTLNDTLTIDMDGGQIDSITRDGSSTPLRDPQDYTVSTNAAGEAVISFKSNQPKKSVHIAYSWTGNNSPGCNDGDGVWSDAVANPTGPAGPL
ncbi:hypothetical protein Poly30_10280 [Planctomycetes bacterium Poly30]|uniref:Uncharacterized protein n=1 Tax=Saltatorellus ferox TaxID=2528018 RepID=A0A518EN66_9BACT|nr:hypothetical protein Poly30_10280 [Planctomycetes bacterium Poly30]